MSTRHVTQRLRWPFYKRKVALFTRGKAPVTQPLPGEADEAYNAFKSKILHLQGREAEEVEPILDALLNLEQLKAGLPIPIPNSGLQVTQLGHVKGMKKQASKQVYNISGDRYVTFDGLARACAKAGGFPEPKIIHYNPKEFDFGKKKAFPFRDQHFFASVEKAKEGLGIIPEYGLVEGLTDSYNLDFGRGTFRKEADFTTDDIILEKSLVLS
ncbi:hypothetical protein L1987_21506 [Smallanthus sonchifolius]|uniref:Uncharacterized protein n=1 Tax=Smallanthus sonchifolius TaxID=185202 RepID=A0ACB9IVA2_9ASTR|nr:hypothetical protein L1987_21506 [Smallanthus sonchifolius]